MYKGNTYKPTFKKPFVKRGPSRPGPRFERRDDLSGKYRKNFDIRAQQVRLVDSDGTNKGVVDIRLAMSMSREQDLDLVEVAPNADPPVCRIIMWSKFVYEQKKKEKEARKHKQKEMKEFQFGTFIAVADRDRQLARVKKFLDMGHNVKLTVKRKGRTPLDLSRALLESLLTQLSTYSTIERNPSVEGKQISIIVKGSTVGSPHVNKDTSNAKAQDTQNGSKTVSND
jgi:translation initiation factor IF-3